MKVKAKFTNKTKQAIFERDGGCIICGIATGNIHFHHYKFGTHSNYGKDRNDVKEGVTLCDKHHLEAHSCSMGEGVRQECYNYINKKYEI